MKIISKSIIIITIYYIIIIAIIIFLLLLLSYNLKIIISKEILSFCWVENLKYIKINNKININ